MASETSPTEDPPAVSSAEVWQIWVDTGGTFTDCLAVDPRGQTRRCKVLSSGGVRAALAECVDSHRLVLDTDWDLPDDFFRGARLRNLGDSREGARIESSTGFGPTLDLEATAAFGARPGQGLEIDTEAEAPVLAAHWVTRTPLEARLPPVRMRLATTRGTNALLERSGSPTALFITRGFGDLLTIGNQQRPELFALDVLKSPPLCDAVVEVEERLGGGGEVLRPLDPETVRPAAERLLVDGFNTAAVALLHSYLDPSHEETLASFLRHLGFRHVSCSAELAPRIRIVPRAETAVVNAYLSGVIGRYLAAVGRSVEPGPLHVLTSAGSLVQAADYLPKDSLLSGPAGGVVGAAAMAGASGWPRSLAFDMGGTSTDVSRFDGELDYRFETRVGDARLLSPSLAIETVAAGGGSICHFDGRQLKVGPESAGAEPGPACYGAGGPMTLTDVNLLLGRLRPESFEIPIDPAAARWAARGLLQELQDEGGQDLARDEMLQGLLDIANERMAEAVRRISIRQGYDPAAYALVAFGGAGGQHACALAEILGIETVLVPKDAGLLSAVGLGRARVERMAERQILRPLQEVESELEDLFAALSREARKEVLREGVSDRLIEITRRDVYLRLEGQESCLGIAYADRKPLESGFVATYQDHYGYLPEVVRIEVESLRVMASSVVQTEASGQRLEAVGPPEPIDRQDVYVLDEWQALPVFLRDALTPGHRFPGPALVFENHCATVVNPDWNARMDEHRCLVLERLQAAPTGRSRRREVTHVP